MTQQAFSSDYGFSTTGNVASGNVNVTASHGNLVLGDATATANPGLSSDTSLSFTAYRGTDNQTMTLGTGGDLVIPGNIATTGSGGNITMTGGNIISANVISANTFVASGNISGNAITLKNTDDFAQIVFSNDGGTTNNGQIKVDGGTNMVVSSGSNFYVKRAGQDRIAVTDTTADFMAATNVRIQSNKAGSAYTWTFDNTGNLAAPGNISGANIVSSSNVSVTGRVLVGNGNATVPSYAFTSDGAVDTGFYWVSDGNIGVTNNGVQTAQFMINGVFKQIPRTVSGLPSASTVGAGARAFVTDANSNQFANLVVGSGIYNVPVFSNGTNWYVG